MEIVCPNGCGVTFDADAARVSTQDVGVFKGLLWKVTAFKCPKCDRPTIDLMVHDNDQWQMQKERRRIWPRGSRPAPEGVPAGMAQDFREAASVLEISPQAAAALARRTLQQVLKDHLGATGGNLEKQIDSVASNLPSQVAESLHALRHLGNFAAHPTKDQSTGEIVQVEPGEAEWTLDTLEALFDHVFVAPARQAERLKQLNEKLAAAGKPLVAMPNLAAVDDPALAPQPESPPA